MTATTRTTDYAERQALGVVIEHPELAGQLFGRVPVAEFTGPNLSVAEAIHALRIERKPFDLLLIGAEMTKRGTLGRAGGLGYLHELIATYPNHTLLEAYTDEIVHSVRRRKVWGSATRAAGKAESPEQDPVELARHTIAELQHVVDGEEADRATVVPNLDEFLDTDDDPFDWVIPGLLERSDRAIITGEEGLGKSVLLRQLAVCTAAGLHPFTHKRIKPQDVLVVDCENTPAQSRRAYRGLAVQAKAHGAPGAGSRLRIECRPAGLDLTRPADEGWLVRTVTDLQPALMVIGPIYRLYNGNPNDEELARAVARVLDRCREAANTAIVVEGHSPHADLKGAARNVRPVGSSLWLRWPEFGYGLRKPANYDPARRSADMVPWRGDRSERSWPKHLQSAQMFPWADAARVEYVQEPEPPSEPLFDHDGAADYRR